MTKPNHHSAHSNHHNHHHNHPDQQIFVTFISCPNAELDIYAILDQMEDDSILDNTSDGEVAL